MSKHRHLICVLVLFGFLAPAAAYQDHHHKSAKDTLPTGERVLWSDPGDPSTLDFEYGIGGPDQRPVPPFQFVSEDSLGTSPKVNVRDARGMDWNIKWGHEGKASLFCTRLLWACGYFAETEYLVARGRIEGVHDLKRAGSKISGDGKFVNARFQLRSGPAQYLADQSWSWADNPFSGTRELQGLKIMMLLLSNWDAKDSRDFVNAARGSRMDSNLAIFSDDQTGVQRYFYADDDWGASLGKWGGTFRWNKWDCDGFSDQTADFIKGTQNGEVQWGFNGKHRKDLADGIKVSDVQWLLQYLGKISDDQVRRGLAASGANDDETACYTRALRQRMDRLQQVAVEAPTRITGSSTIH